MQGNVLQSIGKNGAEIGEFNFPTELRLSGQDLIVVDAMNFRVQVFNRTGQFLYGIGKSGKKSANDYCLKGVAVDSEGSFDVVDGNLRHRTGVQPQRRVALLLREDGKRSRRVSVAGLHIDAKDRIYVVGLLQSQGGSL